MDSEIEYAHTTFVSADRSAHDIHLHEHNTYELYLLLSGKVTYHIEGTVYHLLSGDILAISDKELHRATIDSTSNYERITIFLNKEFIAKLSTPQTNLNALFQRVPGEKIHALLRPDKEYSERITRLILRIERMLKADAFGKDVLLRAYIAELLVMLNTLHQAPSAASPLLFEQDSVLNKILLYINQDLSQDLKLYDIAEKFFISQYHLTRKFKEYTGFSFHQYVQNKRLVMAQHLLSQGVPAQEIVVQCGFNDYSSFVRAFNSKFGISPKQFLKNHALLDSDPAPAADVSAE